MFGDNTYLEDIAEAMLADHALDDIFEMNDLTELEVLTILLERGHISEPERYFEEEDQE